MGTSWPIQIGDKTPDALADRVGASQRPAGAVAAAGTPSTNYRRESWRRALSRLVRGDAAVSATHWPDAGRRDKRLYHGPPHPPARSAAPAGADRPAAGLPGSARLDRVSVRRSSLPGVTARPAPSSSAGRTTGDGGDSPPPRPEPHPDHDDAGTGEPRSPQYVSGKRSCPGFTAWFGGQSPGHHPDHGPLDPGLGVLG